MKLYLIILLSLLIGCSPKINKDPEASDQNQKWNSILDLFNSYNKSNQFYSISKALESYPTNNTDEAWLKLQLRLTVTSYLRNNKEYDELLNEYESRVATNDTILNTIHKNVVSDSLAINKIVESAKDHQVVMLNENHFYPSHRILATDLLVKLRAIGYTYLALETLAETQDSLLNLEGAYPTLETGYYTREQNYGNLLRQAKKLGYKFVAYENIDKTKDREIGEAENLFNKTIAIDPDAKVFVIAGISHILEEPTSDGKKWMATVFKEKYGIDPLTISQTQLSIYRKTLPGKYNLVEKSNFNDHGLNSVDFHILNNMEYPSYWDSTFNYKNKYKENVQIALFYSSELKTDSDFQKAIPYFTALIEKEENVTLPFNKDDEIYLVVYDEKGKVVEDQTINENRSMNYANLQSQYPRILKNNKRFLILIVKTIKVRL
ncbi:hypothetical protein [Albibacterium bauzanense]|uniref:Uncharacterized protein n=1 Tax=Albibacterium bauzanense TaxID=653929 RepID=A0A4R1M178_9SPHI|nr:hypothetical protein [Albibacterium bauzanense]TCK84720.1 hypothetical protein C8N28_0012 [Albibacterium bauzanense]